MFEKFQRIREKNEIVHLLLTIQWSTYTEFPKWVHFERNEINLRSYRFLESFQKVRAFDHLNFEKYITFCQI